MKHPEPDNPFSAHERAAFRTPDPEPADAFWRRFTARAEAPAPMSAVPRLRPAIPWVLPSPLLQGLAAACVILLLAGGGLLLSLRPAVATRGSTIEFLSIDTAHDGLFILEDAGRQAVVVWIDERRS